MTSDVTSDVTSEQWSGVLTANAAAYARVALANIAREFPSDILYTMTGPGDFPSRPSERNPVFYGSFDWHSCVEMHWLLVRLLRVAADSVPAAEIRQTLNQQLQPPGLAAEAEYVSGRRGPGVYGMGWALTLAHEAALLDDPGARRWRAAMTPLTDAITDQLLSWLGRTTYPIRYGVHPNTAFALSRALPFARQLAVAGDSRLVEAIESAAHRWFAADADYPAGWEPSGADFLSPALVEAELMASLLPPASFSEWLTRFLPGIGGQQPAALFSPAIVSDSSDGLIAHLHGLNASRAWCWRRIADSLPAGDERIGVALAAMHRHADAALPHVVGDHFMVEHWLAAYAVLLLS
ncbi:MAG TPA: DUF2891 domain-containing protein [Streptosporangiaceae bacterium]|nr:DUF2891 domain-containing protein [Streptosporangiaceae bacterium]